MLMFVIYIIIQNCLVNIYLEVISKQHISNISIVNIHIKDTYLITFNKLNLNLYTAYYDIVMPKFTRI